MELTQHLLEGLYSCAESLYVIEEKSKTVVYAKGTETSCVGDKCYHAFAGLSEICPFCPKLQKLPSGESSVYIWEYFEPRSKQWLKIKNRLVISDGVQYRVGNANLINDMMGLSSDAVREIGLMQQLVRERDEVRRQLLYELSHDRLTGLLNRNQYIRDIESGSLAGRSCGVLYFDLNNLKEANDRYCHSEGDSLLCRLATAMQAAGVEKRCYRVGGDEFLLIWPGCSAEELSACRAEILWELELQNKGQRLACSVAVGNAWCEKCQRVELLVAEADRRMYEEKRRGKNHGAE